MTAVMVIMSSSCISSSSYSSSSSDRSNNGSLVFDLVCCFQNRVEELESRRESLKAEIGSWRNRIEVISDIVATERNTAGAAREGEVRLLPVLIAW